MRFSTGIGTGRSARSSSKPAAKDIIDLQWQVFRLRRELAQAQIDIQHLQWRIDEVNLLVEALRANGALIDAMSDEDQMVIKHVLKVLKEGGNV